jgi:hypothetical protein
MFVAFSNSTALHLLGSEFLKVVPVFISLPLSFIRVRAECLCYVYSSAQKASDTSTSFAIPTSQKYAENLHDVKHLF